ncbi:MAG: DUF72 domain-containing protein [Candidatus Moduliflexus flocculans]|nr:DUF72 domain-containing protein [Candidatus Moduliflexus flocculans]
MFLEVRLLEGARLRSRKDVPARRLSRPITPGRSTRSRSTSGSGASSRATCACRTRRSSRRYAKSVPEDFVFTVKAPNALTLTHYYAKQTPQNAAFAGKPNPFFLDHDVLCRFLEALSPLRSKLGPIMFQFEYLNKQKMPSKEAFFERFGKFVERAPKGYPYAVEIRNPNYYSTAFFDFLKAHGLGFVYLDGYYMPPIGEVFEKYRPETASFQVVRLHGGDRLEIEGETGEVWNRIVAPKPTGLHAAAKIVRANAKKRVLTYLNLNNHYEGSAPLSMGRFLDVLAGRKIDEATR